MAGWGRRDLKARCRELRELLAAAPHLATPAELADYWPGGAQNKLPPDGQWVYCYAQYSALWRRTERSDPTAEDQDRSRAALLDAFREKPLAVELVARQADAVPQTVFVHPKSLDTLELIGELHGIILWLLAQITRAEEHWSAEDALRRSDLQREVTELHLTQCWILTHEGCEAPFNPAQDLPPLPARFRAWHEVDLLNVLRAHHTLHQQRIDLICRILHGRGTATGEPASWDTLVTVAARRQRMPAEHLMRRRSFGAWLAQLVGEARDDQDTRARADTTPPASRPPIPAMEY